MGKVSSPVDENAGAMLDITAIKKYFLYSIQRYFYKRACFADLLAEVFKKYIQ